MIFLFLKVQFEHTYQRTKGEAPPPQKKSTEAIASSLSYIGGTLKNAFEVCISLILLILTFLRNKFVTCNPKILSKTNGNLKTYCTRYHISEYFHRTGIQTPDLGYGEILFHIHIVSMMQIIMIYLHRREKRLLGAQQQILSKKHAS